MAKKSTKAVETAATDQAEAPASPRGFKVEAIEMGHYDLVRRRPGDVFFLKDPRQFSAKWMRKVPASTPQHTTTIEEAAAEARRQILGSGARDLDVLGDD